jgi:hypothetical protein
LLTIAVIAFGLINTGQAKADLLTFNYVGNPFTFEQGPYAGERVEASITFDMDANFTGQINNSGNVTSVSIETVDSGGNIVHQLTGTSNITNIVFDFVNGQITYWVLRLDSTPIAILTNNYNGGYSIDQFLNPNTIPLQTDFKVEYNPGTWNSVPLPGTLMLLGSGLVGLAGLGRRKFRKS